ncbi:g654 [Coccomyxa viridis]|uniref:Selenoprotein O n=1 Tax=Coccomyxa viridis TaxID=1274662 RepID=A0ABP1FI93_9CHLO
MPAIHSRAVQTEAAQQQKTGLKSLEDLQLESTFTAELPGDPNTKNRRRQVEGAFYSYASPTPTNTEPCTVAYSPEVAQMIGLDPEECQRPEFAAVFSGNAPVPQGVRPYAQNYGGHQFGMWAGQLGDGRAISLGQAVGPDGTPYELQLKGAGETPYSRMADGRAVMRSSVREFIASEAMFYLGIPTTRALSLVGTGDKVLRDMFYNGNAAYEPGAVVCRVSPSFVRFGTFQLPALRGGDQLPLVRQLADYVIRHLYSHLEDKADKHAEVLREIVRRTASLVAQWQAVGFVHGVGNTDNFSILGETIDYGPYGFLERFDPDFTPNTTDLSGRRYSYRNQTMIGHWNIAQLANAFIAGGIVDQPTAQEIVDSYADIMTEQYTTRMARKLGLKEYRKELAVGLITLMYEEKADFTNTFRAMSSVSASDEPGTVPEKLEQALEGLTVDRYKAWGKWLDEYRSHLKAEGRSDEERRREQDAVNPCYVPRNQVMQEVIKDAEAGNDEGVNDLMRVLQRPFEEQPGAEKYKVAAPKEIRMGVELLSCSS